MNGEDRTSLRRWLSRLAMSFFIIAAFLALHVRKLYDAPSGAVPQWQMAVEVLGAVVAVVLGILGLRERHRRRD